MDATPSTKTPPPAHALTVAEFRSAVGGAPNLTDDEVSQLLGNMMGLARTALQVAMESQRRKREAARLNSPDLVTGAG